jgi:predicted PurR-regulated permease PerM
METKREHNTISVTSGTIVRVILFLCLFYIIFLIKDVFLVMLTAIVIASAIDPGTRWFVKRRVPRVLAVIVIYIAAAALVVSAFYFLLLPLVNEASDFLKTLPEYSHALSQAKDMASTASTASGGVAGSSNFLQGFSENFSLPAIIDQLNVTLSNLSSGFFGTVDVVFGGIISFFLIIVLSFYLAVQEDGVGKFLRIVAPIPQEKYIVDLWKRSKEKIGLWMQGQLLLAVLVAVLVFIGLSLVGIRGPLLLAFLAGLFEIIPLFGAFLAAAPAILVAFVDGGVSLALLVTGLFIIIQQFESQLIYPVVVKKVVGVPPIISILAIVIGGKLAGFLGVIISVPVAAILMEILNDLEKRKGREPA